MIRTACQAHTAFLLPLGALSDCDSYHHSWWVVRETVVFVVMLLFGITTQGRLPLWSELAFCVLYRLIDFCVLYRLMDATSPL